MLCTVGFYSYEGLCMYMAGRRRASSMMLVLLFLTSLFIGFSNAEEQETSLELSIIDDSSTMWFTGEESVEFQTLLTNPSTTDKILTTSSACEGSVFVYDETGDEVYSTSFDCSRSDSTITVLSSSMIVLDSIAWDFTETNGSKLESGTYTLSVDYPELSFTANKEIRIQSSTTLFEDFELHLKPVHMDGDYLNGSLFVAYFHYLGENPFDTSEISTCIIQVNYGSYQDASLPCFHGRNIIMPYEIVHIGFIQPDASFFTGQTSLNIHTPDNSLSSSILIDSTRSTNNQPWTVEVQNTLEGEQSTSQPIGLVLDLSHSDSSTHEIDFTSSCTTRLDVINEFGQSVYSSSTEAVCNEIDLTMVVEEGEHELIQLPLWWNVDNQQCVLPSGEYTLIASLPEYQMFDLQHIQLRQAEDLECGTNELLFEIQHEQTSQTNMKVIASLDDSNASSLRWRTPCAVQANILDEQANLVRMEMLVCDDFDGRLIHIPENPPHSFVIEFDLAMVDNTLASLENGDYTVEFVIPHQYTSSSAVELEWISDVFAQPEQIDDSPEPQQESEIIVGQWMGVKTTSGTCWMIGNEDEQLKLYDVSSSMSEWSPQANWIGTYEVLETILETEPCAPYDARSFVIINVIEETLSVEEQEDESVVPVTDVPEEELLSPVVTGAITVVVSTSLLGLLVAFILGNESLRIPTTAAGLWLFALVGKTHETSDGKYQRGRLIGYLTANPGCHFRALMAALEMSNGQITHHIRILEAEERIWRKEDGRLVRYYPYTSHLNPMTAIDDLPIPPLSPDPNSLQGKILNLLDEDGQLGDFPTQSELAKRLSKSQQLISHHLRTLQKYGLVEMRKMGIKNRYKLTKEAIFLLETNDDFAQ